MAHLLLAWELGLGLGHLTPLGLLAHHLSERGHRITLALRQRRHLDALPFPLPFDVIDAPHHDGEAPGGIALSYADMLRRCGYDRPEDALRLYRRWDALLAELKPDMVVAEHAPSALLAAHAGGLPRIAVGNGFTIPPPAGASAALQPWRENDNAALDAAEARVMRAISAICRAAAGAPPLAHSGALIGDTPPALKIFRECDLYQRDNAAGGRGRLGGRRGRDGGGGRG